MPADESLNTAAIKTGKLIELVGDEKAQAVLALFFPEIAFAWDLLDGREKGLQLEENRSALALIESLPARHREAWAGMKWRALCEVVADAALLQRLVRGYVPYGPEMVELLGHYLDITESEARTLWINVQNQEQFASMWAKVGRTRPGLHPIGSKR